MSWKPRLKWQAGRGYRCQGFVYPVKDTSGKITVVCSICGSIGEDKP